MATSRDSATIPEVLQVGGDGGVKFRSFGLLLAQRLGEPLHLVLERFAVVLQRLCADVATRREHVAVLSDFLQRRCLAEAGYVGVLPRVLLAAPGVVGAGDTGDVFVGQLAVGAIHHAAELAGVEEEYMAAAIAPLTTS